jgi:glycylpeptide N-tetradecanoyltransferase
VHKKLRSKRLAPVLIKEITRRVNHTGIFQAVYTAGIFLPKPFASSRYYHRNMNSQKLIDVGFSRLPENTTISQLERKLHIPDHTSLPGFGQMTLDHVPQVAKLLENYLCQFDFFVTFTEEEVKHYFLPSDDLFYSYVVQVSKPNLGRRPSY